MKHELRTITTEARAKGDSDNPVVEGLGILYDQWAELWPGYKERINRGAVKQAPTVKSFFNHDPSRILATTDSTPPLVLEETDKGLKFTTPIPPTTYGKDLAVNLERGNVRGSSFAFDVPKGGDKWWEGEDGITYREINKLNLYEVGPVTDPAFVDTTAALRTARAALEEWQGNRVPVARLIRQRRQKLAELEI